MAGVDGDTLDRAMAALDEELAHRSGATRMAGRRRAGAAAAARALPAGKDRKDKRLRDLAAMARAGFDLRHCQKGDRRDGPRCTGRGCNERGHGCERMTITIWHNPRCSKSRETLELLRRRASRPPSANTSRSRPSKAEVEKLSDMVGGDAGGADPRRRGRIQGAREEEGRSQPRRHRQGDRRPSRSCCSGRSSSRASAPPSAGRRKRCCRF